MIGEETQFFRAPNNTTMPMETRRVIACKMMFAAVELRKGVNWSGANRKPQNSLS